MIILKLINKVINHFFRLMKSPMIILKLMKLSVINFRWLKSLFLD